MEAKREELLEQLRGTTINFKTFVAGYTNGYIFYSGTGEQLRNTGSAQEDSDTILAPEWQQIYEDKVAALLKTL